jgi:hypothetical protein
LDASVEILAARSSDHKLYGLRSIVAIIPGGGLEFLDMRLLGILIQFARRWSKTEAGATEEHLPKPKCLLITDNVLVAFEALHTMQTRMKGKKGYVALKLDMSKAYDRVKWGFLEEIMRKLGFGERWIGHIMQCVQSVTYGILINGTPFGNIHPTRGLRQGDPLSPYLFLLCAEGLSALLHKAEVDGHISRVPIAARGYKLSHLSFADDSMLFCRATFPEWENVMKLLKSYELASGQKLNNCKTSIYFSCNSTRRDFIDHIKNSSRSIWVYQSLLVDQRPKLLLL